MRASVLYLTRAHFKGEPCAKRHSASPFLSDSRHHVSWLSVQPSLTLTNGALNTPVRMAATQLIADSSHLSSVEQLSVAWEDFVCQTRFIPNLIQSPPNANENKVRTNGCGLIKRLQQIEAGKTPHRAPNPFESQMRCLDGA